VILSDLRAWVIAYAGAAGQGYVGKLRDGVSHGLSPVDVIEGFVDLESPYVLASGYVATPQRQLLRPMMLFPLELFVSSPSLRVHYNALLRLRDLENADFDALAETLLAGIEQAEGMRASIRSQRSGIVLAPAGAKPEIMRRG